MRELVLPNDANTLGYILGGRVMHLIDLAGFFAANKHCRQRCVTAAMEHLDFKHPIRVGQAVLLEAEVVWAGHSSMDVRVRVESEHLLTGERLETSTALLTFVAIDEAGKPTRVPALTPQTPEEQARYKASAAKRKKGG